MEVIEADYRTSALTPGDIPEPEHCEVVFFGRSNVGKSSLLNKLSGRKSLARTSKQPGRTQALNFFDLEYIADEERKSCTFVDAPGYGFAEVGKVTRKSWGKLMEAYIEDSSRYSLALLLVDSRRDLKEEEKWIIENTPQEKLFLVATKADKLSQKEMSAAKKRLGNMLFVSTLSGKGVDKLRDFIVAKI